MDLSIEVQIPPTALFQGRGSQVVSEELVGFTEYAVNAVHGAVVPRTPINLGMLRNAWGTKVEVGGVRADVLGRVFNPQAHAVPVEEGSKPHWPPLAPLILWAQRKFSVTAQEARSIGFLVARAIARRGTPAKRMAREAVEAVRGQIESRGRDMLRRIAERLGR